MNQTLQNKEIQSIYSDACENSEEIEQIYLHSKIIHNQQVEESEINQDNSHMKLYSKDKTNKKENIGIINVKENVSASEYKSCYEEKIKENDNELNNNLNINLESKILDNLSNIRHVDLSTINSNNISNTDNFF